MEELSFWEEMLKTAAQSWVDKSAESSMRYRAGRKPLAQASGLQEAGAPVTHQPMQWGHSQNPGPHRTSETPGAPAANLGFKESVYYFFFLLFSLLLVSAID